MRKASKIRLTIPQFCQKYGGNVVSMYQKIDEYSRLIGSEKGLYSRDHFQGYRPVIDGKKTLMEK